MTPETGTIKLFLPFGDPTRLRTAELSNWSGKALAAPRSDLGKLFERDEPTGTGVYILTGVDVDSGRSVAYIGEAEDVRVRLNQHDSSDYWNQVILFTSKDDNLTKAHVKFLEGALIRESREIGRSEIKNVQQSRSKLPESDIADMEVYLSKVRQILPVLGSLLLTPVRNTNQPENAPAFSTSIKNLTAHGEPTNAGFVVFKGSQAVPSLRESAGSSIVRQRDELIADGSLEVADDHLVFTRDVEFSSPSLAVSVVQGGNTSGLTKWIREDGRSLRDVENQEVSRLDHISP